MFRYDRKGVCRHCIELSLPCNADALPVFHIQLFFHRFRTGNHCCIILRVTKDCNDWDKRICFAENCSWEAAGVHPAEMMKKDLFTDWESVFCAKQNGQIIGFCTFLKTDYYPENRYSPWISSMFVHEDFRGNRISRQLIECVAGYAKEVGFTRVYIPSGITGLYEKNGFQKIDVLMNYSGDTDNVFTRNC